MKALLFTYALQAILPDGNIYILDYRMTASDCMERVIRVKRENEFYAPDYTRHLSQNVKFSCILEKS